MAARPEMVLLRTLEPPHVVCFFCGSSALENLSCDYFSDDVYGVTTNTEVAHNFLCHDCHSDFAVKVTVEGIE